ncbi:MAG: AMP-binding protein [Treponema sp.]|nr:AMP-binding protein [Treponema sp.]
MYKTLPQMIYKKSQDFPELNIQFSKNTEGTFLPTTYKDFVNTMLDFSAGLLSIGEKEYSNIGLICDNRKEWLVCSMGIMATKSRDIPRGSEATIKDLSYILSFAECKTVVTENKILFNRILECKNELPALQNIIIINPSDSDLSNPKATGLNIFSYDEILSKGSKFRQNNPNKTEEIMLSGTEDDSATIIFTSGTTGTPKGVELTHKNFLCQVEDISKRLPLKQGNKALCMLPVWHVYERELEYFLLYVGVALCYSKPAISMLLADMKKVSPQFMATVPRIWDGIYNAINKNIKSTKKGAGIFFTIFTWAATSLKSLRNIIYNRCKYFRKRTVFYHIFSKFLYIPVIFLYPLRWLGDMFYFQRVRNMLGGKFQIGMSGGGSLPLKLDKFFNSIGIRLVEGYGLTETAPICCIRNAKRPILGTIGKIMPYCQAKVVHRNGIECKPGEKGVLYIKGPNVMKGYYKQPELTAEVISEGEWFNTGDLVIKTYNGEIIVKGRQKDTIVLRSGENVEPLPIEDKLSESIYISQAVVVGQDENCLGALIIPDLDNICQYAKQQNINFSDKKQLLKDEEIKKLIYKEMERLINTKNGFKPFEKIGKFVFLDKPFEVGVELSPKQGIIRYKINELYKAKISLMYADSGLQAMLGSVLTSEAITNIQKNVQKKVQDLKNIIN